MIEHLRTFPDTLRRLIASVPQTLIRTRAKDGRFAIVENAWHLADLESEGYAVRIHRILDEDDPYLPDFKGDAIAADRNYLALELEPALERFAAARAANVVRLESLTKEQLQRGGEQEGEGRVTLRRVIEMMAEHDAGHAEDLRALLEEILRR